MDNWQGLRIHTTSKSVIDERLNSAALTLFRRITGSKHNFHASNGVEVWRGRRQDVLLQESSVEFFEFQSVRRYTENHPCGLQTSFQTAGYLFWQLSCS